ncbi:MAG: sigma-54 dependent transcriptional regulator [Vicinamibacteria bacterium]
MRNEATGPLSGLLGRSTAMKSLRDEIAQVGPSDLRILIRGETGTGKEQVARALHAISLRARVPLVPFNAAGYSDELVEAELFGHTRGAFTGAHMAREGYVAAAEHGTLFLDEVADLTSRTQAKLLRFLDDGEYHRLGETGARRADVRVLSATNVDLSERVRQHRFREDLWYRLKDHCILVPPLREREGDVLFLARHFLHQGARSEGREPRLGREAETAIARYSWPGNVRQLEREMRRAAVMAGGGVVELSHLSDDVRQCEPAGGGDLRAARDEFERDYVRRVVDRHDGMRTAAAAELGITRQALFAKIRRLRVFAEGSGDAQSSLRDERRPRV